MNSRPMTAPICATGLPVDSRSRRAISGFARCAGCEAQPEKSRLLALPWSALEWKREPSVCVIIRSKIAGESTLCDYLRGECYGLTATNRFSATRLTSAQPIQGGTNSGRNDITRRIGRPRSGSPVFEQFERAWIGPLRVLEQHQDWLALRKRVSRRRSNAKV